MKRSIAPRLPEVISLGGPQSQRTPEAVRWGFMLVIFMRIVGVFWLIKGLLQWRTILLPEGGIPLDSLPATTAAGIIFFAVGNLLAAVGLWLAASWGGVLWLFTAVIGLMVALAVPELRSPPLALGADLCLIVAYFALTWLASREREG